MLPGLSEAKYIWLGNHGNIYHGNVRLLCVTLYNPTNNATMASMGKVDIIYDMIYLLNVIGLSPGGSSTVHIYTQTLYRTTQNKQYIERHKTNNT